MYNILIVDDEYYICEGLKAQLLLLALPEICEIHTCLSGEEALLLCQTYKPQIVFTDIKMEGMDGISLIHALSRKLHPVQFIILSGYDDFHYVRGAFQNGAADYLLKPVLTEDLGKVLTSVIESLSGHSRNPDRLRKQLFQLSADVFRELSVLPLDASLSRPLTGALDMAGIKESCCIAVLVFSQSMSYEFLTRQINLLFDSLEQILAGILTDKKIGILCSVEAKDSLAAFLTAYIDSCCCPAAASLTESIPVSHIARQFRRAHELLCLRLFHGYNMLFSEADARGQQDFSPRLKHFMTSALENPSLISNQTQRLTFLREIRKLSLSALIRFYNYFNSLLEVAVSDNGWTDPGYAVPPLSDFTSFKELEEHLCRRLLAFADKKSAHPCHLSSMEMVKKYIDAHYMENLTLSSLADRFFMSYSYLSKSFHKSFHMPFQQYLLMLRMEHALELLKDKSLSVQQIATRVGYENAFNFSRSFKAQYGVSPSHFRSRSRE